ncbi:type I restriction enzyme S subunit [Pseudomonas frederiksbergensis]|uniref:restriction endonuclease subunit S n=1 Tax=Pseudomonas frederiksbergensis TaxID=104087 RepID=UPI003D23EA23
MGQLINGFETGRSLQASGTPAQKGEFGVLKISAVTWGRFQPEKNKALFPADLPLQHEIVRAGDLLISRANTSALVGAPVLVDSDYEYLMLPDKILRVLYRREAVDPRYLLQALRSHGARMHMESQATGTSESMRNLSQPKLRETPILLAPLAEQKRIADKLDALLIRIDACRRVLDCVPSLLKRFRQAVLTSARSGALTEEWRSGLPPAWPHERAADVCSKVQSGGTPREGFSQTGIPFLKVYNIVNQKVSFDYKPQYITHEIHMGSMSKSLAIPGDVLMNIVGPPLGKVAVVPNTYPEWNINQAITLFRPNERISSGWLYCVLCEGSNIAEIAHETRGSAGQSNISLTQCRNFLLPIPPADEQAEIVRRVESLFVLADTLEAKYKNASAQVEGLIPALLAKAFRGELVRQDLTDEPASQMLERIAVMAANQKPIAKNQKPLRRALLKSASKDQLSDIVGQMPKDGFTFEELSQVASRDYESLKEELFRLLADKKSGFKQFFDDNAKSMKFKLVRG